MALMLLATGNAQDCSSERCVVSAVRHVIAVMSSSNSVEKQPQGVQPQEH
jgi:hypothetical protein